MCSELLFTNCNLGRLTLQSSCKVTLRHIYVVMVLRTRFLIKIRTDSVKNQSTAIMFLNLTVILVIRHTIIRYFHVEGI